MDSNFVRSLREIGPIHARSHRHRHLECRRTACRLSAVGRRVCRSALVGDPDATALWITSPAKSPGRSWCGSWPTGEIEGAVRGNLPAGRTMRAVAEQFQIRVRRLALLELSGWAFLLGPVGIDEGETMPDRLELLLGGARFLQGMGVAPKAAVLSGGRMEDMGRCERVDRSLLEGELIAARAREAGVAGEA